MDFSEEHKQKMNALFESVKAKEKKKTSRVVLKSVAIIILGVVVIMGAFTPKIKAWKEKILQFFIKDKEKYSWISYGDPSETEGLVEKDDEYYKKIISSIFGYIPEGYECEIKEYTPRVLRINLIGHEDVLTVKVSSTTNNAIDTERVDSEHIVINGVELTYYYTNGINLFTWNNDNCVYDLHSTASKEELIKIIENINYQEIKNIF